MADGNLIQKLRAARRETIERYAPSPDADLEEARNWRGAKSNLRFRLAWLAEGGEATRVRVLGLAQNLGVHFTDAQLVVAELGRSRGHLLGERIGFPDAAYDREPCRQVGA